MLVMPDGIVTEVTAVLFINACRPIAVTAVPDTLRGIVTVEALPLYEVIVPPESE